MTNKEKLDYHIGLMRINSIWLDMFFSGKFDTEEKWRNEMDRRLSKEE